MSREHVILVDRHDRPVGTAEKVEAHRRGLLHRALSVVVVNARGEVLIQRRAAGKYHSGGLWANTCCSHPRPGEDVRTAARRRLREEMGLRCRLEYAGAFLYRAQVGAGLIEHEYDHVFLGRWDGSPRPAPQEVDGWRWAHPRTLRKWLRTHPERFAPWFPRVLRQAGLAGQEAAEGPRGRVA
jgi:isopentenyl-diphosphate Delta-isomerase